jgi:hypothetical protein
MLRDRVRAECVRRFIDGKVPGDAQRENPGAKYVNALLNEAPGSGRFILAFHDSHDRP